MPGLMHDPVRVAARITHRETVFAGMRLQPCECGRCFEGFLGGRFAGRADIERATAMVFGIAGRGVHGQDLVDGQAARPLAVEDAQLVIVAAIMVIWA